MPCAIICSVHVMYSYRTVYLNKTQKWIMGLVDKSQKWFYFATQHDTQQHFKMPCAIICSVHVMYSYRTVYLNKTTKWIMGLVVKYHLSLCTAFHQRPFHLLSWHHCPCLIGSFYDPDRSESTLPTLSFFFVCVLNVVLVFYARICNCSSNLYLINEYIT